MFVPDGAAISKPVCDDLLILLPAPNLEVIVPETGLISEIPKFAFPPDVVSFVLTVPVALYILLEDFFATFTTFGFSTYNLETASSVETNGFNSVSYFSTIDIPSIFELSFSFKVLTTFSASSKLETYSFSSWLFAIA